MSWFNNDAGFAQNTQKKYTKRFWMPNDTERLITFIDTPTIELDGLKVQTPFKYNEYQLQLNGSWRNWFTQPIDPSDDVLKDMGYRASKVAVLTAIDHAEWTDRNGVTHRDELCLYVVKRSSQVWKQIERFMERGMDLSGQTFLVSRMGDKSPGSGSMLEKHSENFPLDPNVHVPFNYLEILKPKSKSEIEAIFNPDANDPFKQGKSNDNNSFGATNHNGWGAQTSEPANNWQSPINNTPPQQENRVFGSTSGNNGSDPIPF